MDAILVIACGAGIAAWLTLLTGGGIDEAVLAACVAVMLGMAIDDDSGGEWIDAAEDIRKSF